MKENGETKGTEKTDYGSYDCNCAGGRAGGVCDIDDGIEIRGRLIRGKEGSRIMKKDDKRRPLSVGTVFMLGLLAVVLVGSAVVLGRLSSGASVDLSKLNMQFLDLQNGQQAGGNDTEDHAAAAEKQEQKTSEFPEAPANAVVSSTSTENINEEKPKNIIQKETAESSDANAKETETPAAGSYTLTVAGAVSLEGEVLKNSWNADSKAYDLSDIMLLLKPELHGDLNAVFIENILSDTDKANDTVAPEALADLLQEAGFRAAAGGFSKAYDKGPEGIAGTWMTLDERSIIPTGIRPEDRQDKLEIITVNGVKTAFLQYTATVPSKTRKKMVKAGTSRMVPEAEIDLITEEIDAARSQGAEAVIVLLKWGKTDNKPDSKQQELAAQIAKAGADLIIGNGSRIPQGAEYLSGKDDRKVLCIWSLGSLLTGDRTNPKHMAGYLLNITIRKNGKGGADILAPEYTPVYTWKYKQDGRYYYRCLASDQPVPDGMDSEQQKTMAKAEKTVSEVLAGSPLSLRSR